MKILLCVFCKCICVFVLFYHLIARLHMDHDTLHIGEVFFDICLDHMRDEVSLSDTFLTVDEDVYLGDPIESTLADDTTIGVLDLWM